MIEREELEYIGDMLRPDALDQHDTVSLQELAREEQPDDQMKAAGIDDLTPVDTFMAMQGRNTFVTEI